jgi:hypothetical protein
MKTLGPNKFEKKMKNEKLKKWNVELTKRQLTYLLKNGRRTDQQSEE